MRVPRRTDVSADPPVEHMINATRLCRTAWRAAFPAIRVCRSTFNPCAIYTDNRQHGTRPSHRPPAVESNRQDRDGVPGDPSTVQTEQDGLQVVQRRGRRLPEYVLDRIHG